MEALKTTQREFNPTEALQFIKKYLSSWKNCGEESITFQRLTGLTNRTYRVEANQAPVTAEGKTGPQTVFLRVFEKDGLFFDRSREMTLLEEIHSNGLGPEPYGYEGRYRLEEFYQDSRTLKTTEMNVPQWRKKVAHTLSRFHSIKPDGLENKIPLVEKMYMEGEIIKEYHEKIEKEKALGTLTEDELDMLAEIEVLTTPEEAKFLKSIAPAKEKGLVFSHNDLLPGNVLVIEEKDMVFIDYEYSSYNYRGYDIANYLNEAIIDYTIPETPFFKVREEIGFSQEDMADMIFHYVVFSNAKELGLDKDAIQELLTENELDSSLRTELEANELVQRECQSLLEEIKACTLMSHAYWIIWAVVMSKNKEIDFDYLKYAHDRYKLYEKLKNTWYDYADAPNNQ